MNHRSIPLLLVSVVLVGSGCATTPQTVTQIDQLSSFEGKPRILLMEPDVKYYLLRAGGIPEPNAEWTELARVNFMQALTEYAKQRNSDVVSLDSADATDELVIEYDKLHGAVGSTVLLSHFGMAKLPAKAGRFDWGLGPGVSSLGERYGADYALFSFYRDYQASGGRVAFAVLAAAAGVGVPTTAEFGFASLVDLRTGDIVWFNKVDAGGGELRKTDGARRVIEYLFKDLPQG
jgi:hypothetical protein